MQALQKLLKIKTVPVIKIDSVIDAKCAARVTKALKRINAGTAQAVALVVNSPGGSPTQCEIISSQIKNYCKQHKLPLYTFADDIAASGGYFLHSIGDKTYVDESSLVGSVGVIFGFQGIKPFLDNQKVEVRQFTTQENLLENLVDPTTQNLTKEQKDYVQQKLSLTHKSFINHIEQYRGDKITLDKEQRQKEIYNADVFMGSKAVELGLADEVGNYQSVLSQLFPQAQLDFVTRKTFRERCSGKGVSFSVNLPFGKGNVEQQMSNNMTAEYLKQFKN